MALRSWPWLPVLLRASIAEIEDAGEADDDRSQARIYRRGNQIARRPLRVGRQSVDFRSVHQQIEGVQPAEHLLVSAVEIRLALPRLVQLLHARLRSLSKLADGPKLNRLGRAGFRAGGLHPALQPVVTERALLRGVRNRVDVDHAERTGRDAVAAPVAGVRLDDDGVELGSDDRARRADFKAGGVGTMLAHVAHHQPSPVLPVLGELLDELDVAPMDAIQSAGVVVAVPTQRVRAAVGARQLIPFFAGHLAGFAADADRRVCVEAHRLWHTASRSLLLDVADERLAFVNRYVGIPDKRRHLVDDIAGHETC